MPTADVVAIPFMSSTGYGNAASVDNRSTRSSGGSKRKSGRRRLSISTPNGSEIGESTSVADDASALPQSTTAASLFSSSLLSGGINVTTLRQQQIGSHEKLSLPAFQTKFDVDAPAGLIRTFNNNFSSSGKENGAIQHTRPPSGQRRASISGSTMNQRTRSRSPSAGAGARPNVPKGGKSSSTGRRASISGSTMNRRPNSPFVASRSSRSRSPSTGNRTNVVRKSQNINGDRATKKNENSSNRPNKRASVESKRAEQSTRSSLEETLSIASNKLTKEEEAWRGINSVLGDGASIATRDVLPEETSKALRKVSSHAQTTKLSNKFPKRPLGQNGKRTGNNKNSGNSIDQQKMKGLTGGPGVRANNRRLGKNNLKTDQRSIPSSSDSSGMPSLADASFSSLISDSTDPRTILSFISSQKSSSFHDQNENQVVQEGTNPTFYNPLHDFMANMTSALQQKREVERPQQILEHEPFQPTEPKPKQGDEQLKLSEPKKATTIQSTESIPKHEGQRIQGALKSSEPKKATLIQPTESNPKQEERRMLGSLKKSDAKKATKKKGVTFEVKKLQTPFSTLPGDSSLDFGTSLSQFRLAQSDDGWTASSDEELPNGIVSLIEKKKKEPKPQSQPQSTHITQTEPSYQRDHQQKTINQNFPGAQTSVAVTGAPMGILKNIKWRDDAERNTQATSGSNGKGLSKFLPKSAYFPAEERGFVETDELNNSMPSLATYRYGDAEEAHAEAMAKWSSFGDLASTTEELGTQFAPATQAAMSEEPTAFSTITYEPKTPSRRERKPIYRPSDSSTNDEVLLSRRKNNPPGFKKKQYPLTPPSPITPRVSNTSKALRPRSIEEHDNGERSGFDSFASFPPAGSPLATATNKNEQFARPGKLEKKFEAFFPQHPIAEDDDGSILYAARESALQAPAKRLNRYKHHSLPNTFAMLRKFGKRLGSSWKSKESSGVLEAGRDAQFYPDADKNIDDERGGLLFS